MSETSTALELRQKAREYDAMALKARDQKKSTDAFIYENHAQELRRKAKQIDGQRA